MSSLLRLDPGLYDKRTDMLALGTTIYAMVTGLLPFPDFESVED
jgi:serine/threonine protein kinase